MEEEEYASGVETLSKLCDEQGLQHYDRESPACETHVFVDKAGNPHECWDSPHGMVNVVISMTPEQAVMLGTETCRNISVCPDRFFCCSECGQSHIRNAAYVDMPHFCPNCGKRVTS